MKALNTVRELIRSARENFSDLPAVMTKIDSSYEYEKHTYRELFSDVKRVGRALCEKGLIGKKIIICGENGYEWVVSYLAVTGYCGIAVPLSRTLAPEDFCSAARHCDAEAIIYGDGCRDLADSVGCEVMIPFSSLGELKAGSGVRTHTPNDTDTAELAYSSGTEGKAKAVVLSHKNICESIALMCESIRLCENDRFYSVLPLTHTSERILGLLVPLSVGASVAYGEGLRKITANMRATQPTVMLCVPFILDKIYEKIKKNIREKDKAKAVSSIIKLTEKTGRFKNTLRKRIFAQIHESLGGRLRLFFSVGDSVKYRTIRGLSDFGLDTVTGYGLTETAGLISVNDKADDVRSVGIHKGNGLTDIYNIQSDGVGEIRYRGANVTSGYYKDSKETEDHIKDGWLYTGDMGYADRDGRLRIVGRKGNIITTSKRKQIYPEELEEKIIINKFIKECAVVGVPNGDTGDYDVVSVIYPDRNKLAESYGEGYTEVTEMHELYAAVDEVNERFADTHKQISRIAVRDTEFEKTADGKIIRSLIKI